MIKPKPPESENMEYKSNWNNDCLKVVSAFANTSGGELIIGVDDNKNISTCAITTETQRDGVMILEKERTEQIIGAAIEVHRYLRPGLLESALKRWTQETCLLIFLCASVSKVVNY